VHAIASLPVAGSNKRFPVRRVYCVGRNYAAHAVEMGHDPDRELPFFSRKIRITCLPTAILFTLAAADLIMTGTPAGVGPVSRGDVPEGEITGVGSLGVEVI